MAILTEHVIHVAMPYYIMYECTHKGIATAHLPRLLLFKIKRAMAVVISNLPTVGKS